MNKKLAKNLLEIFEEMPIQNGLVLKDSVPCVFLHLPYEFELQLAWRGYKIVKKKNDRKG